MWSFTPGSCRLFSIWHQPFIVIICCMSTYWGAVLFLQFIPAMPLGGKMNEIFFTSLWRALAHNQHYGCMGQVYPISLSIHGSIPWVHCIFQTKTFSQSFSLFTWDPSSLLSAASTGMICLSNSSYMLLLLFLFVFPPNTALSWIGSCCIALMLHVPRLTKCFDSQFLVISNFLLASRDRHWFRRAHLDEFTSASQTLIKA